MKAYLVTMVTVKLSPSSVVFQSTLRPPGLLRFSLCQCRDEILKPPTARCENRYATTSVFYVRSLRVAVRSSK